MITPLDINSEKEIETFYTSCYKRFVRYALYYVNDLHTAEDMTHDALLYYWEHKEQLTEEIDVLGYILLSVKNKCLNYLKHLQVEYEYNRKQADLREWEIRRERCVELMGSGFRFDDIKRWKKGAYLSLQPVGVKINNIEDYNSEALANSLYNGVGQFRYKNCVTYIEKPNPGWTDKCYLYPIPLKQTVLNPNLVQNLGW